jgi:hypothetical protein
MAFRAGAIIVEDARVVKVKTEFARVMLHLDVSDQF